MNDTTILGTGTARGGTQSLAYLLNQWEFGVTHEGTTSVAWNERRFPERHGRMRWDLERGNGDVSFWLVTVLGDLLEKMPSGKGLFVRRPKEDVVASLTQTMPEKRIRTDVPFGGMVFPAYPETSIEEAWGRYWEDHHRIAEEVMASYPNRTLGVKLSEIEQESVQEEIAAFLELQDWSHVTPCHKGKRQNR